MLKYFNNTIISTLSILPLLPVGPVTFVLKLKESVALIPLKSAISLLLFTAGISLVQYYHNLQMFLNNNRYIQVIHWHYYIIIFSIIYLGIFYFAYAISKWSTNFKYYFFISIIWFGISTCSIINWYISFNKYICITVIT